MKKRFDIAYRNHPLIDSILIGIIGTVYILDQLTKHLTEVYLCFSKSIPATGQFRLTCSFNTGSAFGLFPNQTFLLICASIVAIAVLILIYKKNPFQGHLIKISLGLQLGGSLGNLTDRLRFGQVTDFIQLGFWPVFNLADASIVIGVSILIWLIFFSKTSKPAKSICLDNSSNPLDPSANGDY